MREQEGITSISAQNRAERPMLSTKLQYWLILGISLFSLSSFGQTSANNAGQRAGEQSNTRRVHELYVGVHVAAQLFYTTSPTYPIKEAVVRPLYFFAGYQLNTRNAIQLGFLQRSQPVLLVNTVGTTSAGQPTTTYLYYAEYRAAVPLLLRHSLNRPIHRFQVDALLGLTFVIHNYQTDYVETTAGQIVYEGHSYAHARNLNATAGLSASWVIVPRLALMVEGTTSLNLKTIQSNYHLSPTVGLGAGLRYRFAIRKKADATAGS